MKLDIVVVVILKRIDYVMVGNMKIMIYIILIYRYFEKKIFIKMIWIKILLRVKCKNF